MENLGEILKRLGRSTSGASTGTSSRAEPAPVCPLCRGRRFLNPDVPPDHPDFGRAVPCQCVLQELEGERLTRLQRYSNLGPLVRLTFDNLVPQGRSGEPENQERFQQALAATQAFAQEPSGWLVLAGPSGCGKTHLACAIANYRLGQGHPAFFQTVPDLLGHLRATFSPQSDVTYDDLFEQVRTTPLLILDDLGAQSETPWAEEKLYQVFNHRFNQRLPTVVTTSAELETIPEKLRTRLLDPELSHVVIVEKKTQPLLRQSGSLDLELLRAMTFETFQCQAPERPVQDSLERAFRIARRFAEAPEGWLVLLGITGCGKTHLAAAIANYRRRAGQPVYFAVVPELLDRFRSTFSPESRATYDEVFEMVKAHPLLVLDDLGAQSATPWASEKLYQLLNYRYNARLPTVITSRLTLDEIIERFTSRVGDPRLSLVITINAPDARVDRTPPPPVPPGRRRRG